MSLRLASMADKVPARREGERSVGQQKGPWRRRCCDNPQIEIVDTKINQVTGYGIHVQHHASVHADAVRAGGRKELVAVIDGLATVEVVRIDVVGVRG